MFQFETMTGIKSARDCLLKKILDSISILDHFSLAFLLEIIRGNMRAITLLKTINKMRATDNLKPRFEMRAKVMLKPIQNMRAIEPLKTITRMRAKVMLKPIRILRFNLARVKGSFIRPIN